MPKREIIKKTSELLITIKADPKEWRAFQEKALKELTKNLIIKGFRKGQVPINIAKKHIGQEQIFSKAVSKQIDLLVKVASKEINADEMILDSPTYKVNKLSDVDLEVVFIYPLYPKFEIANYKNMDIKYIDPKLENDIIDSEIQKLLSQHSLLKNKDDVIAKGDTVLFDFDGLINGEQFDGSKAEGYELEIGSGQFIPGFEEQMIGAKKGETKDVKVTFPETYHVENLKSKDAKFKVTIHEVKFKETPVLDDKFVKESGVPNVNTVSELREYIGKVFLEQEKQNARSSFQKEVFQKLKKETEIPIPPSLVSKEMENITSQFSEQLKQQGITKQQYEKMTGINTIKLDAQFKTKAEDRIKDSLLFAEISKLEKIKLSDEDYKNERIKLAKVYNQTPEGIEKMITKEQMQIPMINSRVIDVLIKYAK